MTGPGRIWMPEGAEYAILGIKNDDEPETPYTRSDLHPTAAELREVCDNLASMILALDAKGEHHSGHYVVMLDAWANRLESADKA